MIDHSASRLLDTARITGADLLFLHVVQRGASQLTGSSRLTDPAALERVATLHEEFREACAAILEKHLGRDGALASLTALESAPLQRYLAARQAMGPALRQRLAELKRRMGNIEI